MIIFKGQYTDQMDRMEWVSILRIVRSALRSGKEIKIIIEVDKRERKPYNLLLPRRKTDFDMVFARKGESKSL